MACNISCEYPSFVPHGAISRKCLPYRDFCGFYGKPALTSRHRADKNANFFAAGGELRPSEWPSGKHIVERQALSARLQDTLGLDE
jgi:hypothetical protein